MQKNTSIKYKIYFILCQLRHSFVQNGYLKKKNDGSTSTLAIIKEKEKYRDDHGITTTVL